LQEGRLDEASVVLERWLKNQPQAAEAHYLKARLAWAQNDFPLANDELTRARALGYALQPLAGLRGLLLAQTGHTTEAEPLLREVVDGTEKLDPDIAETLTHIYLGGFRLGRAADLLDRWVRDWPGDARPYFLQTEIEIRSQASAQVVIAHCQAALERDPTLDQARLRLADLLRLEHRNVEAEVEYTTYLKRKSKDPLGHLGAGQNALDMGNLTKSSHHLDLALALSPQDSVILGVRAAYEIQLGDVDAARRYLDQAVKADPFDYGNRYRRMLILTRQGNKDEAEADRLAMDQIRRDEAEFSEISRQLQRDPLDLQLRSQAARWLMNHGHGAEAVNWATLVLRSSPSDPAMNRLLADYYRKKGNLGLANFHEAHAAPSPSLTQ